MTTANDYRRKAVTYRREAAQARVRASATLNKQGKEVALQVAEAYEYRAVMMDATADILDAVTRPKDSHESG